MDQIEGVGIPNVENWLNVYTGSSLKFEVSTGLIATAQYRFRVRVINEYLLQSPYSQISVFYAATLPDKIKFPTTIFTNLDFTEITLNWL